jgi:WD40 repeat protein
MTSPAKPPLSTGGLSNTYLSYAPPDADFVRLLDEEFRRRKAKVWIDWEAAPLTDEREQEIRARISAADYFVFVLSPDSAASPRCLRELTIAAEQDKRIVSVTRREVAGELLPPALREAAAVIHFIRPEEFRESLKALLGSVETELKLTGFISYSRRDQEFVDRLSEEFGARGRKVWVDRRDIRHTEEWLQAINSGIDAADNFIFVISEDSVTSPNCAAEIRQAASRNKRFVPVLYRTPASPIPQEVSKYQFVPFSEGTDFDANFQALVEAVDADLEYVNTHTWLTTRALEWSRGGDDDFLLRGDELRRADAWFEQAAEGKRPATTPLQREFFDKSRRRQRNRRVMFAGVAALVLAVVSVLSAVALNRWREARQQRLEAQRQERIALSRRLVSTARSHFDDYFDLALLLALEADAVEDTPEARSGLLEALQQHPRLIAQLGRAAPVSSMAHSAAVGLIATGSADGAIVLWNVARRAADGEPLTDGSPVRALAFSNDGGTLAAGGGRRIVIWDVATRRARATTPAGDGGEVAHVAFSPDGGTLVSCSSGGAVEFWEADTLRPGGHPLSLGKTLNRTAFSPDGRLLAVAAWDGVTVWDVGARRMIHDLSGEHNGAVYDVAFSPDGRLLASGSLDGTVILWDRRTWQPEGRRLAGHEGGVNSLAFVEGGRLLATGGDDGRVVVWNLESREPLFPPLTGHRIAVTGLIPLSDGGDDALAAGNSEGEVVMWNINPLRGKPGIQAGQLSDGGDSSVEALGFSPDGRLLAAAYQDGRVLFYDPATRRPVGPPLVHEQAVTGLSFTSDGEMVATGSLFRTVTLWGVKTRQKLGALPEFDGGAVSCLSFSPDNKLLAVGVSAARSGGGPLTGFRTQDVPSAVILFDVEARQQLGETLSGYEGSVTSVAFTKDGRTLVAGLDDGDIRLWDVQTRRQLGEPLKGDRDAVQSIAFSSDGRLMATGGGDNAVVLWDIANRRQSEQPLLSDHRERVLSVAFSPDGRLLASSSQDGTIILWDVAARQRIGLPITGHGQLPVSQVAFSPDGKLLASGGQDGFVNLWDTDFQAWKETACRKANRSLTQAEWAQYLGGLPYRPNCMH